MPHPIQPLEEDSNGVVRFKANDIVRYILDHGGVDLNDIARLDFSREDREQFAQLIGYSWSGACDLGYMSDEVLDAASAAHEYGVTEAEARVIALREQITKAKEMLREGVAELYRIHPDDLNM